MTPQEKAEELITNYRALLSIPNAPLGEYKDHCAIQCALLAVDEILNEPAIEFNRYREKYWKEVKQHLENKL